VTESKRSFQVTDGMLAAAFTLEATTTLPSGLSQPTASGRGSYDGSF
jgi:hypothetical protein